MLNAGMRFWSAAALLLMTLCLASTADARNRRYYGYFPRQSEQSEQSDRYRDRYDADDRRRGREPELEDARSRRSRGGTFSAIVDQLTRVCVQTGSELKSWPFDAIAQTARPDDGQRSALEEFRSTVVQAADALASDCPRDVPVALSGRLQAADQGIETAVAALNRDASCILSWSSNSTVRLWDVATGQTATAMKHDGAVGGALFEPRRRAASCQKSRGLLLSQRQAVRTSGLHRARGHQRTCRLQRGGDHVVQCDALRLPLSAQWLVA